jgi:WD40 repeat protein
MLDESSPEKSVPHKASPSSPSNERNEDPDEDLKRLLDEEGKKTGLNLSMLAPQLRALRERMKPLMREPESQEPSRKVKPSSDPPKHTIEDLTDQLREHHEAAKTATRPAFGGRNDYQQREANHLASNFDDAHEKIRDLENRMSAFFELRERLAPKIESHFAGYLADQPEKKRWLSALEYKRVSAETFKKYHENLDQAKDNYLNYKGKNPDKQLDIADFFERWARRHENLLTYHEETLRPFKDQADDFVLGNPANAKHLEQLNKASARHQYAMCVNRKHRWNWPINKLYDVLNSYDYWYAWATDEQFYKGSSLRLDPAKYPKYARQTKKLYDDFKYQVLGNNFQDASPRVLASFARQDPYPPYQRSYRSPSIAGYTFEPEKFLAVRPELTGIPTVMNTLHHVEQYFLNSHEVIDFKAPPPPPPPPGSKDLFATHRQGSVSRSNGPHSLELVRTLTFPETDELNVTVSDDGEYFALRAKGKDAEDTSTSFVKLFDTRTGDEHGTLHGDINGVEKITIAPGGKQVATLRKLSDPKSQASLASVWEFDSGNKLADIQLRGVQPSDFTELTFDKTGKALLIADSEALKALSVWSAESGQLLASSPVGPVSDSRRPNDCWAVANDYLAFRLQDQVIYTTITRRNPIATALLAKGAHGMSNFCAVALSSTGVLATIDQVPGGVHFVDPVGKAQAHSPPIFQRAPSDFLFRFSPISRALVVASDAETFVVEPDKGKIRAKLPFPIHPEFFAASNDSSLLFATQDKGRYFVIETQTGKQRASIPGDPKAAYRLSPGGKKVCAFSRDGEVRLYDATTGEMSEKFMLSKEKATKQFFFTKDARKLLARTRTENGHELTLWNLEEFFRRSDDVGDSPLH